MKKIFFISAFLLFMPAISFAAEKKTAVYFYADWCPHCQNVDKYFTEQGFYDKYDIEKLDFDEPNNKALLQKVFVAKNITSQAGIPAVIIDDVLITGDRDIIAGFDSSMEGSKGMARDFIASLDVKKKNSPVGISFPVLLSAALVDAINPCAFAVLILLMATVINARGKKGALWAGLMFSSAIFISYFLMGLGLYKVITFFNIPLIISTIVGVLAVLLGLANIKDAFWYGKFFVMEVPLSWRPKMKSILRRVTNPFGALIAGFSVSLFLLPCSSGPYIVIVGLLAERVNTAATLSQLALYNLIFVFPMVAITLAMYFFNVKGSRLEQIRRDNLKLLHAIGGSILLVMGIYLLKGWL